MFFGTFLTGPLRTRNQIGFAWMMNLNHINRYIKSIFNKCIINQKYTNEINSCNLAMKVKMSSVNYDQCFFGTVVTKPFL